MALTAKQKAFVQEYLIDLNATQAAIRAGYSVKSANRIANENMSKPDIQTAIHKAMDKRAQRTEITADRVLQELAKIGFANMADYAEWGPKGITLKGSTQLTADQAAAVSEVSETVTEAGGSVRFKLHNKIAALERIGKHLGMFDDRTDKDKPDPNAQITALADLINNPAPERVLDDD
ncbi:terminase small subunit [Paenibacillus alvei]|uniref:terminase small subunit n=1 Tax=Paenibacillus alvei TaxID=44250 RepID=UPI002282AF21|nr:terminase small subunit [Paenibacillus alvei]MCY9733141.1 terminase small subunit [Paenibacillus alvei]